MFPTIHRTVVLALTATLFAGAARAQSLDGEVVRNPDDTVTYTLDIDGPPRGQYQLFASIGMAPTPFPLPPFGLIFLDPFKLFVMTSVVPLDDTGKDNFQLTVPTPLTAQVPVCFQSVNIDEQFIIRVSQNAIVLNHNVVPVPNKPLSYTFAYDTGGSQLRMAGTGEPGSVVQIRIVNSDGVRVTKSVTIGQDCKFFLSTNAPGGITTDDDVMVILDGGLVDKVDLHRFK